MLTKLNFMQGLCGSARCFQISTHLATGTNSPDGQGSGFLAVSSETGHGAGQALLEECIAANIWVPVCTYTYELRC